MKALAGAGAEVEVEVEVAGGDERVHSDSSGWWGKRQLCSNVR
jgi:hypothetical protein